MKTEYASAEDRAAQLLYERLGKQTLFKDKDGKPIKYEKVYPSLKGLISICKKGNIDLPKSPKMEAVLLAMARAGYNNIRDFADPGEPIKSLSERVYEKAQIAAKAESDKEEWTKTSKKSSTSNKKKQEKAAKQAEIDTELSEAEEIEAEIEAVDESNDADNPKGALSTEWSADDAIIHISNLGDSKALDRFLAGENRKTILKAAANRDDELKEGSTKENPITGV